MKLDKTLVLKEVKNALAEDIGRGDVSAMLLPEKLETKAEIINREPMLLCGRAWVEASFQEVDASIEIDWFFEEGAYIEKPGKLCQIKGPARAILTAERTALNFLQTLSATATQTYQYLQCLKGLSTKLLDTRKTLPGLRLAQKYAVATAGGTNHRIGLFDAYLIKENHIRVAGSIKKAIAEARHLNKTIFLEIEVESLTELKEALEDMPDRVLLDNFDLDMLKEAVLINKDFGCQLEASGGVDLSTIRAIAETGVDFISVGSITKSIKAIDLSLLVSL